MELKILGSLLGFHGRNIESNFSGKRKQKISRDSQTEWSLEWKQISKENIFPIRIADTDNRFCFGLFSYCSLLL